MLVQRKSFIALILGAFFIAFSPVLIKMTGAPGIITVFYRMFFGTIALLIPFAISRYKSNQKLSIHGLGLAVLAGLFLAIDMAFWATGIMLSNAAMPTLVGNMAPLWVGIGSYFIFKERQSVGFWFGLLVALAGVAFLILRDFYVPTGMFAGLILGLFAGVFYAGYMLATQSGRKLLDTISYLFVSSLSTSCFLAIFALVRSLSFTGYPDETWVIFIFMGIAIQAGAWFLINFAQGFLPASLVSPTLLAQPVLAGIIAYFLLGEVLSLWHIAGGLIVVLGIYMVHFSRK